MKTPAPGAAKHAHGEGKAGGGQLLFEVTTPLLKYMCRRYKIVKHDIVVSLTA